MLRRKTKQPPPTEETTLGVELSLLDVVVDACKNSGRRTVMAESGGDVYTVMIDRGGPFNATAGNLSGAAVLEKAASLRQGSYTVIESWPVDQPLYQLGLDTALHNLSTGTTAEAPQLPAARGVDAMRNADWAKHPVIATAPSPEDTDPFAAKGAGTSETWLVPEAPAPTDSPSPYETALLVEPAKPVSNGKNGRNGGRNGTQGKHALDFPQAPWMPGHTALEATRGPEPAPPKAAEGQAMMRPQPATAVNHTSVESIDDVESVLESPPLDAYAVVAEPLEAAAEPVETAPGAPVAEAALPSPDLDDVESTRWLRAAAAGAASDENDAGPAAVERRQGRFKRGITAFLLWTVQVENEPGSYTLGEALKLVGQAFLSSFSGVTAPIARRGRGVREDWRKSGEAVAKQRSRASRRKPAAKSK